jgi:hypothetical protein
MRFQTPKSMLLSFSILSVLPVALLPTPLRDKVPVIVDLEDAFGKLPPSSD